MEYVSYVAGALLLLYVCCCCCCCCCISCKVRAHNHHSFIVRSPSCAHNQSSFVRHRISIHIAASSYTLFCLLLSTINDRKSYDGSILACWPIDTGYTISVTDLHLHYGENAVCWCVRVLIDNKAVENVI